MPHNPELPPGAPPGWPSWLTFPTDAYAQLLERPGPMPLEEAVAELTAALGFGFLASDFVRQPEIWPVFLEHVRRGADVPLVPEFDRAVAASLTEMLAGLQAMAGLIAPMVADFDQAPGAGRPR